MLTPQLTAQEALPENVLRQRAFPELSELTGLIQDLSAGNVQGRLKGFEPGRTNPATSGFLIRFLKTVPHGGTSVGQLVNQLRS